MGTLFPDDEGCPSYVPMPSPVGMMPPREAVIGAVIVAGLYDLCPCNLEKIEDPPHREAPSLSYFSEPLNAVGSTSAAATFFGGNSIEAANDVVRNHHRRRAAQTRLAASMSVFGVL